MTDKYITSSQYEKGIRKIKEYVDKSIPHVGDTETIFTIPANTALEIIESEMSSMEFDKPSNINLEYDFIVNYNNKDFTNVFVEYIGNINAISMYNNDIRISFIPGYDINHNANETKMVVTIIRLNPNITLTDIVLKQINKKCLNNKYLKRDVAIKNSITIGTRNKANDIGQYSFSSGRYNIASGPYSHAEGFMAIAKGENSHAEGENTTASGKNSHAEGYSTIASGTHSHAEGVFAKAEGDHSHAEGSNTTASGENSHAEGNYTTAGGNQSHVEGYGTKALGENSHAEGEYTIASGANSHVQGKYNIEDTENKYAYIVGNGSSTSERSNAHTLDWSGNAWYAGKLSQEGTPTEDKDLTTKKYVDANNITDAEIDAVFNELSMRPIKRYKINYDYDKSACVVYPTPSYMYENDEVSITVAYPEGYSLQAIIVMQGKNNITNNVVNSDRNIITLKSINDDINVKIVLKENGPL